jgi:2-polyprenyl-3-methyl-5-hydroxy-6-metoxy-1,4-benzoquinol methylase
MEKWVPQVRAAADHFRAETILDYGCGKAVLSEHMVNVRNYDPAVEKYSTRPEPADLVVCSDVLEHIEPDCLDAVLDDLVRVTLKGIFFTVSTVPANKHFEDGRNAHVLVRPMEWWFPVLMERWKFIQAVVFRKDRGFQMVMVPK